MELFCFARLREDIHLNTIRKISGLNINKFELSRIRRLSDKQIINNFYERRSGASTFALISAIDICLNKPKSVVAICGCGSLVIADQIRKANSDIVSVDRESIKFYNGSVIKLSKTFNNSVRGIGKVFIDGPMDIGRQLSNYMTLINHEC